MLRALGRDGAGEATLRFDTPRLGDPTVEESAGVAHARLRSSRERSRVSSLGTLELAFFFGDLSDGLEA